MEKEQLEFNFWYSALWSWKYGKYSQTLFIQTTLFRVGLARYPQNRNQTCIHGGHSGAIPLTYFVLLQILFCQENFLLKI